VSSFKTIEKFIDGSYEWSANDYVYSMLVEDDAICYISPRRFLIIAVVPGHGLIRLIKDVRQWTNDQVVAYVGRIIEDLRR
jgi:hypothetical protein